MSLRQRAVRGAAWAALQNWGSSLLALVIFAVLARLLAREDFGLLALAVGCVAVAEILLKQGMGQALIQREDLQPEHLDTAFWTSVGVGCALALLALAAAGPLAGAFGEPRLAPVLRVLGLNFIIGGLANTQIAVLEREFRFKSLALRQLIAVSAGGIVGIGMALAGMGVWSLVGQFLSMNAVGVVVLWSASPWRPRFRVSRRRFWELFGFGAGVMGVDTLTVLNGRGPDLVVGYILGAELLGLYNAAFQILAMLARMLMQSISAVALPTFSRIQHDLEQTRNAYLTAVEMSCLAAFPLFAGLAALAPDIIGTVLGAKWAPSAPAVRLFALVGMIQAFTYFNRPVLLASGRLGWLLKVYAASVTVNLLAIALACFWGRAHAAGTYGAITCAAGAYAGRLMLFAPLWLALIHRAIGLSPGAILRPTVVPLVASAVMTAAVLAFRAAVTERVAPQIGLGLCVALGALVYTLLVLCLAPMLVGKVRDLLATATGRDG
jgi:PST family polysaccharide transporter